VSRALAWDEFAQVLLVAVVPLVPSLAFLVVVSRALKRAA
jgi:hypothetical protein